MVFFGMDLHGCGNISFERHVGFIHRLAYEMQVMLAYCRVAPDGHHLVKGHQAGCCGHFIEMNLPGICEKGWALDLWTLCATHGLRLSVSSGVLRGRSRYLIGLVACGFRSSGALSAVVYFSMDLHGCENISFERHVGSIYGLA